jgi:hypothetical protein
VAGLFALYGVYQGIFRTLGKALATDRAPGDLPSSARPSCCHWCVGIGAE